jgi:hypothetical protein
MHKASKVTVTVMAVGIATISLTAPVHAGNRSAVSAGTWVLVSAPSSVAHSRREVYVAPPPPVYYAPPPPPVYYAPPPPPVYYDPVIYGPPPYRAYRRW